MIEVFKTNIDKHDTATEIATELQWLFPSISVTFDLDDCDRILRVSGEQIHVHGIQSYMQRKGHICEVLD
jgi:hypothetical protein